jgi:hypothetical protein
MPKGKPRPETAGLQAPVLSLWPDNPVMYIDPPSSDIVEEEERNMRQALWLVEVLVVPGLPFVAYTRFVPN